jgi:MFS family permease
VAIALAKISVPTVLLHRPFRTFFIAQSFSLIGTWMQQVSVAWLLYRLTGSPSWLGLGAFVTQAPTFFLSSFGGVVADRFDRRKVLLIANLLAASQSLTLALLALSSNLQPWNIVLLGLLGGCIAAFEIPARQALLPELVRERADLPNAIALNAMAIHVARFIGPAAAGWIIYHTGEVSCFILNTLTYAPLLTVLLWLRSETLRHSRQTEQTAMAGFRFAWRSPAVRGILISLAAISLLAMPYAVLMPVFVAKVLGGGAQTLGTLLGTSGAGAILASAWLAAHSDAKRSVGSWLAAPLILAIGLGSLCWISNPRLALGSLALIGFATTVFVTASNIFLQTIVPEHMRARIMSLYAMAFMGTIPFGNLIAGAAAQRIGVRATLALAAIGCLAAGLVLLARRKSFSDSFLVDHRGKWASTDTVVH